MKLEDLKKRHRWILFIGVIIGFSILLNLRLHRDANYTHFSKVSFSEEPAEVEVLKKPIPRFETKNRSTQKLKSELLNTSTTIGNKSQNNSNGRIVESEFIQTELRWDLIIQTTKLVSVAVDQINSVLRRFGEKQCSKWRADPLEARRNQIIASTSEYDDRLLQFEAHSAWESAIFQVTLRVHVNQIEFLNETFSRIDSFSQFLKGLSNFRCFNFNDTARFGLDDKLKKFANISCSCDQSAFMKNSGYDALPTWPVNSSFMIEDYLNYNDSNSLFNIVPPNGPTRHCHPLKMLIITLSSTTNFEIRQAIRETYGSKVNLRGKGVEVVFLLARTLNDTIQSQIEAEAAAHSDIIQGNFIDTYHNLTLKRLVLHAYVVRTCSGPTNPGLLNSTANYKPSKFVMKVDDDWFLNVDLAIRVGEANPDIEFIGFLVCGDPPLRDTAYLAKFYTPRYTYSGNVFPAYLSGVTQLMTTDFFPKLLQTSLSVPLLHHEDVYIGLLARELRIYPRRSRLFGWDQFNSGCELDKMVNSKSWNYDDMRNTWKIFSQEDRQLNCTELEPAKLRVEELTKQVKARCHYD